MIKNHSSDNQFVRGSYIALTVIAITLIYLSTLFRKDAWLILAITFALYGILRLAKKIVPDDSVDKLERILLYGFILLSLIPFSYGVWLMLVYTKVIGR